MEEKLDRELEAILKLIKLTQDRELIWKASKPWGDLIENETTKYSNVFFCEYEHKRLRIFIEKKRIDKPDRLSSWSFTVTMYGDEITYPYWSETIVLEVTNLEGQSLWRFPDRTAIANLLSAAKYQVAGIKDILDSLLSKPS